jgi:protein-tyrosine-phosphatase
VPGDPSPAPSFTVLLVCTGNICRSALAERLGRAYLDDVLGEQAASVRLVSAGTRAVVGSAMHELTEPVLRGFGTTSGDFSAQQLTESLAVGADLTLTMTRSHRREVLRLAPRALSRTFTLREAADLLGLVGEGWEPVGDRLEERARSLVKALAAARARRTGGDHDDVPDPIGGPAEAHAQAGAMVAGALLPLLDAIAATAPGHGPDDTPLGAPQP